MTAFELHKPPFRIEEKEKDMGGAHTVSVFSIRDAKDNAVGFSFLRENAALLAAALNFYYARKR